MANAPTTLAIKDGLSAAQALSGNQDPNNSNAIMTKTNVSDPASGVSANVDANGSLQMGLKAPGTVVTASSTGGAQANTVSLAAAASKTTYITGFVVTGLGATAAGSVAIVTTGLTTNLNFTLPVPAGVTVGVAPLIVEFPHPLPASAVNTAIGLTVGSFGTGNTAASVAAYGFQL